MDQNKVIDFKSMLYKYLHYEYIFSSDKEFKYWPWSTQIELKQLQAILFAFSGESFNVEAENGTDKIRDAFNYGFGREYLYCNNEQIQQLKEILPQKYNYFTRFQRKRPRVGQFYETLFRIVCAGYKYITLFSSTSCAPVAFSILNYYKSAQIDRYIDQHNNILIEAMKIVLDENFRKSFTIRELIKDYSYPDVSQDEIEKYNDNNF